MTESAPQHPNLVEGAVVAAAPSTVLGPSAAAASNAAAAAESAAAAALSQESTDGLGALTGGAGGGPRPPGSPFKAPPRSSPTLTRSHTLASGATPGDDNRDRPSALSRVFNPPKLERKHSSGDLHSRLKTRKILGVGETDNGDIHRSKISQVLGHNEHLYVKLPKGFWSAHVVLGIGVSVEAALLLLFPSWAAGLGLVPTADSSVPTRLAGAALAGLCVFVWSLIGTSDKLYARTMLLSMLGYHILSIIVSAAAALSSQDEGKAEAEAPDDGEGAGGGSGDDPDDDMFEARAALFIGVRATMCLLCVAYFYSIVGYSPIRGTKPSGFRQPSHIHKEN